MAVVLPRLLGVVVGLAFAGMVTAANAVTYNFTGVWVTFNSSGPDFPVPPQTNFSGTFTVDENSVDLYAGTYPPGGPGTADYTTGQATITLGDGTFSTSGTAVHTQHLGVTYGNPSSNNWNIVLSDECPSSTPSLCAPGAAGTFTNSSGSLLLGNLYLQILLSVGDDNGGMVKPALLSSYQNSDVILFATLGDNRADISGYLTSLNEIPLPAAFPLFATALAGMGLLGWRRKRKAAV